MKKLYIILLLISTVPSVKAQVLGWDFSGNTGSEVSVSATTLDPNITVSAITRGSVTATALANAYAGSNWTLTNSLANAIANNSYFQFTAKANAGFQASFTELSENFRRSAKGPSSFQWRYSIDGSNFFNVGSQISYAGIDNNGMPQSPLNLDAVAGLQNLDEHVTVTFRLYGFNAVDPLGIFGLGRLPGSDLNISGKVFPSIVVPIKLISFSAVNNSNTTHLHWQVNCTSSYIKFDIQRAGIDGIYNSVYNSTETAARCAQPFDVNDDRTAPGTNFYRLKMTDIDGKITFSNTLRIQNKETTIQDIKIFPTVVSSNTNLSIPSDKNYTATILIINNQGSQVNKMEVPLYKGVNSISVNTSDLVAGKYYIQVSGGTTKINTLVLIKQ
ncbi:MAG: hypothetical protein ABI741_02560 [Ferruginibacter sp.]